MTTKTQDIVSSIEGTQELLEKAKDLFKDKKTEILYLEDGFQIHVENLPYFFQFNHDEIFGWNVFLTSVNGGYEDDEQTDVYYHELEDAIDCINEFYNGDGNYGNTAISNRFVSLKSIIEEKVKVIPEIKELKNSGKFMLEIMLNEDTSLKVGFSTFFKQWVCEISNEDKLNKIEEPTIRQFMEEVSYQISDFNQSM